MLIGSRELTLRNGDGECRIAVHLFAPQCEADGAWTCRYDIGWPEGLRSYAGWGVDSVQALLVALGMIGAELHASSYHASGHLFWGKPGNGYGFPVAPTLRDVLQGDDAKFF